MPHRDEEDSDDIDPAQAQEAWAKLGLICFLCFIVLFTAAIIVCFCICLPEKTKGVGSTASALTLSTTAKPCVSNHAKDVSFGGQKVTTSHGTSSNDLACTLLKKKTCKAESPTCHCVRHMLLFTKCTPVKAGTKPKTCKKESPTCHCSGFLMFKKCTVVKKKPKTCKKESPTCHCSGFLMFKKCKPVKPKIDQDSPEALMANLIDIPEKVDLGGRRVVTDSVGMWFRFVWGSCAEICRVFP